jgi:hypothetical protein
MNFRSMSRSMLKVPWPVSNRHAMAERTSHRERARIGARATERGSAGAVQNCKFQCPP